MAESGRGGFEIAYTLHEAAETVLKTAQAELPTEAAPSSLAATTPETPATQTAAIDVPAVAAVQTA